MVKAYAVPLDDQFLVIEQYDPRDIIYSPTYLGIDRTDGLVIIQVMAGHSWDMAAKQAMYRALVDNLAADPGVRWEDVQVIITYNDEPDLPLATGLPLTCQTTREFHIDERTATRWVLQYRRSVWHINECRKSGSEIVLRTTGLGSLKPLSVRQ